MGLLINGQWSEKGYATDEKGGHFEREQTKYHSYIGPGGDYPAETGRYHLYVSLACPWAHRTLIFRKLKGLEDIIGVTAVKPYMGKEGWSFDGTDPVNNKEYLRDIYLLADEKASGRVTVPVLWDKKTDNIVNNESSEIIRIFNSAFDSLTGNDSDYYPEALRREIDDINGYVYERINNGVYKTGFASKQDVYDAEVKSLFEALDTIDRRLARQRYLVGDQVTEADWRLFTTLVRFDAVYHGHFKCNIKRLKEYVHLYGYMCELYQMPGVADTVDMTQIKEHYYTSHDFINPTGIIAAGPRDDWNLPHGREKITKLQKGDNSISQLVTG